MHAVELEWIARFAVCRQDLHPAHGRQISCDFSGMLPIDLRQWVHGVNLQALDFGLLQIILHSLLLCSRSKGGFLSHAKVPLSQAVVLVSQNIRCFVIVRALEKKHLTLKLRVWVSSEDIIK